MSITEILLIGLGLSMDAVAVSISNSLVYNEMSRGRMMLMPVFFGAFQGIMPLLGYYLGSLFADFISRYAGIITLLILGIIGAKMIYDAFRGKDEALTKLTVAAVLLQAFATSIDAFAVGVSFCASGAPIYLAAPLIAVTTFICSLAACLLGRRFGHKLGKKAQILGGAILIIIGIKAMFF